MLDLNIQQSLKADEYIYFDPSERVITIYDYFYHSRNDYDHLSMSQRNYIVNKLKAFGLTQKTGSLLQAGKINIYISKPISLGVSPLPCLEKDLKKYDFVVTTPTALFMLYLMNDAKIEKINELLIKCPVNLDQARDFSIHESFYKSLMDNYTSFKQILKENEIIHKFKRL